MAAIVAEAVERHGLCAAAVEHRVGAVPLSEPSVIVAASAPHRGEAFAGAREIIDRVKAEAPIWKREVEGGEGRWVEGSSASDRRLAANALADCGRARPPATARDPRRRWRSRVWRDAALVGLAGLLLIAARRRARARPARPARRRADLRADRPDAVRHAHLPVRLPHRRAAAGPPVAVRLTFSFSALAWLASAACGALAFVLMRRFGVSRRLAAALALCLVTCPPLLVASLRQGRAIDPESLLVMLAGTLAIVDRRPLVLALIVLAGALVRESSLFLIPFAYAIWAQRPLDARRRRPGAGRRRAGRARLRRAAARDPDGRARAGDRLRLAARRPGRGACARRCASPGSPCDGWPAPSARSGWPRRSRCATCPSRAAGLVLVALCAVAMTFAQDWGRIVLLAAPVFYVAAAHVLDRRRDARDRGGRGVRGDERRLCDLHAGLGRARAG